MKLIATLSLIFFTGALFAQRDLTPSRKRDAFGTRDFNNYKPFGLSLNIGPTYTLTRTDRPLIQPPVTESGTRYQYERDPRGRLGFFLDVGMAHFPMKARNRLQNGKTFRLLSYWDWGIGIQQYSGAERMRVDRLSSTGEVLESLPSTARWSNTYAYGRIAAHNNIYIGKLIFIDNALGLNFDYQLSEITRNHNYDFTPAPQSFQNSPSLHLHYGLGIGFKLRRNLFLIPSGELPVFGIMEYRKGTPAISWFSSSYWPMKLRVKLIYLFKDKAKAGDCFNGSPEDAKRNKEYRQNR